MGIVSQFGLDSLLTLLQNNSNQASGGNFTGDAQDNVAFGGLSNDFLIGNDGNDFLGGGDGGDGLFGGNGLDRIEAGPGNDSLFGDANDDLLFGSIGDDFLAGGDGNDLLEAEGGIDVLIGGSGTDVMKGAEGFDQFVYEGNVFANGTPALAGQTGINVLNRPDIILDYTIGEDKFAFDSQDLAIENFAFQKGQSSQIGDGNAIVLTDPFPAAGAAARAIANNPNITADEGVFAYFNSTLGITRLVYSKDLSDGGDISVLANLGNQRGDAGLANINNFSANDFALI